MIDVFLFFILSGTFFVLFRNQKKLPPFFRGVVLGGSMLFLAMGIYALWPYIFGSYVTVRERAELSLMIKTIIGMILFGGLLKSSDAEEGSWWTIGILTYFVILTI